MRKLVLIILAMGFATQASAISFNILKIHLKELRWTGMKGHEFKQKAAHAAERCLNPAVGERCNEELKYALKSKIT